MRGAPLAAAVLSALTACSIGDVTDGSACGSRACGFTDHHYDSTFYCPPAPFVPGGWYGYTWHVSSHCHDECTAAASWGCSTGACDSSCDTDTGSGAWLACTAANGGEETASGCFLSGSGVNGETVPCVCR